MTPKKEKAYPGGLWGKILQKSLFSTLCFSMSPTLKFHKTGRPLYAGKSLIHMWPGENPRSGYPSKSMAPEILSKIFSIKDNLYKGLHEIIFHHQKDAGMLILKNIYMIVFFLILSCPDQRLKQ